MKVLVLHNDYLETGGEFFSVRAEVSALADAGVDVRFESLSNTKLRSKGVGRHFAPAASLVRPDGVSLVREVLENDRPDIVHGQNLFPQFGGATISAIGARQVPWVRSIRNYRLSCISANHVRGGESCFRCDRAESALPGVRYGCYRGSRLASAGAVGYSLAEYRAARHFPPSAALFLNSGMREKLAPLVGARINKVVPNIIAGGNSNAVDPCERSSVLFVGRLEPEKGIALVLAMAQRLPDIDFEIVGVGSMQEIVNSASYSLANLKYLGEENHDQCMSRMSRARVVIVPSQWDEPFGRVAAEALSVGALPIVSPFGGLPDIVEGLEHPSIASANEIVQYCAAIRAIMSSSDATFSEWSRVAVKKWHDEFSPGAGAERLIRIYQSVLETWPRKCL